ncbi:IclR family transcriptional regulator [Candidatus Magnetomoraceae bacterium gMMP-15]
MASMKTKSYSRIDSIYKCFDILRFIRDSRKAVSGKHIANEIGYPQATVMSHLATLEDLNVIKECGGGLYELGMELALFWAKMKARKEHEKERVIKELNQLNGGD